RAELAIGPRQITALSGGTRNPMEMIFTPYCCNGMMMFFPFTCVTAGCSNSQSNIVGMDGPKMSASIKPTLAPACARATARLVVTVDLPTPPLPEAIATIFLTPGNSCALSRSEVTEEVIIMSTATLGPVTFLTAVSQSCLICSFRGHAGVVRTTVKLTL